MTISLIRGLLIYAQGHFDEAVKLVESEFVEMVKYYYDDWWPAKLVVERAVKERKKVSCSRIKDKLERMWMWWGCVVWGRVGMGWGEGG